ncbi:MAG: DUF6596 domain-containing protein [Pseudomonadota bacterium]
MTTGHDDTAETLDRLIRRERGRIVAGLIARLGPAHLDLAEDVAQDAVLAAMASWSHKGLPDNPSAWITKTAQNKAIDKLRRDGRLTTGDQGSDSQTVEPPRGVLSAEIGDADLQLIVLCCHPALTGPEQVDLILKLVSGFRAVDIATATLSSAEAVGQRLARAKRKLREAAGDLAAPSTRFELRARQPIILRAIYLLFTLGYAPRTGDRLIHNEICREAVRLAETLIEASPGVPPSDTRALGALLCFQAARLPARADEKGRPIKLEDQDRELWDHRLIARGFQYLAEARENRTPSDYILEAIIASIYVSADPLEEKHYHQLRSAFTVLHLRTQSPIVGLNLAIVIARGGDPGLARMHIEELLVLRGLDGYPPAHFAHAEVLQMLREPEAAKAAYAKALAGDLSAPVRAELEDRMNLIQ